MNTEITADELLAKFDEFADLLYKFRKQDCSVKNLKGLEMLITSFDYAFATLHIAHAKTAVLNTIAFRMGKILMVVSGSRTGITNGWETSINYTWRADSKVGQRRVRDDINRAHCSVYLYTPETDSVENVTELFKNTDEYIDFNHYDEEPCGQ